MNTKLKRGQLRLTLVTVLLAVLLLFMLFPFMVMISTMLKPGNEVYSASPHWIPHKVRLQNFVDVWVKYNLLRYFQNSLIIAMGTTLLNMVLSVPAAYAVARLRFRGRKFVLYLYLVIQMFSPVIVVISLFKTFASIGLLDSYLGLIIVNTVFTLAFSIWMMSGYFRSIPKEIEEAGFIDGCSRLQTIGRIIIPIAAPGIVVALIYTFITSWNEFLFALSFLQSERLMPLTIGLYNFVGRWTTQWEYLCAASFFAILPVLILFYFIEKNLIAGLTGGAVKA